MKEGGELVREYIRQEAENNLKKFLENYIPLKNMIINSTDEEFEEYLNIAIQMGDINDKDKLREEFLLIKNG